MDLYIGTYTRLGGAGICAVRWTADSAPSVRVAAATVNPSFLALHPSGRTLYAVNELADGSVSAFARDPQTGDLTPLGAAPTGGAAPCHLALHPDGRWLAVANYTGGQVAVFALRADGGLGTLTATAVHHGRSVNPKRQEKPHPHGVYWSAAGDRLWVPDLGTDEVVLHSFDDAAGRFRGDPTKITLPAGCGPRHLALHPSGEIVYVINELDSTLATLSGRGDRWTVTHLQSTLPAGFAGESTTAEIALHPNGRWLYGSNRGHDSLALFDLAADPARPQPAGHVATAGATPRHFTLTPDGRHLVAANQGGHNLALLPADPAAAAGAAPLAEVKVMAPVCVLPAG